ncbi:NMDA receptor-regulated protein 1-domain-containing protein [Baffinella frigidus]|nr:NMDA receptor-regulated protein 1-domain-containing protein [Cryptophyta sp. CCMP2293]
MASVSTQVLPQKEGTVFKTIVKFYETKQYKKGLKAADSILKKFPDHGETLAMKGLTLNCLEKKVEAYEHVRLGLKKNLTSHVCWHVYGLLYRSDRDYKEAIKCYKQALKRDKDNTQILRDLSLLQIQMRELQGFAETRRQLLTLNSKNRNTWIGFAVATHVAGDLGMAMQILEAYEGTLEEVKSADYEHSEMLMYKAQLMEENGDLEACLVHLNRSEALVLDRMSLREKRAAILLRLGKLDEGEKMYRALLAINSDNLAYHEVRLSHPPPASGLLSSRGYGSDVGAISGEKEVELGEMYAGMAKEDPRCFSHKRMPLDFLTGDRFKAAFARYVQPFLRKGIPSLFSDVKPLYKVAEKVKLMEEVMLSNLTMLEKEQKLSGEDTIEPPVTILWVLEYLANHFDRTGDSAKALSHLDRALAYTPTVIDLHLTKARIYKHAGDFARASDECEVARKMDLADRCAPPSCFETADTNVDHGAPSPPLPFPTHATQRIMQFSVKHGARLSIRVDKHFTDIVEDQQFDFHSYCMRKMTLRSYIALLRTEDTIYRHKFFVRAACAIITVYIALVPPPAGQTEQEVDPELAGMNEKEVEKVMRKRRKAERKAEQDSEQEAEEAAKAAGKKGGGKPGGEGKKKKEDADPDGELLAKTEDPMGDATKFVNLLAEHAGGLLQTQTLSMDVFMRKGRLLKALAALKRAAKIAPSDPLLHRSVVRFLLKVADSRAAAPAPVVQVR